MMDVEIEYHTKTYRQFGGTYHLDPDCSQGKRIRPYNHCTGQSADCFWCRTRRQLRPCDLCGERPSATAAPLPRPNRYNYQL